MLIARSNKHLNLEMITITSIRFQIFTRNFEMSAIDICICQFTLMEAQTVDDHVNIDLKDINGAQYINAFIKQSSFY